MHPSLVRARLPLPVAQDKAHHPPPHPQPSHWKYPGIIGHLHLRYHLGLLQGALQLVVSHVLNSCPLNRYSASRLNPATAVKYQFSQLSFNSMLLVPPPSSPDTRPLYHISVHLNCFMPFSFITSVRRGGNQDGEFVGEFELGVNAHPATLFMDGEEVYLNSVLVKMKGSHQLVSLRSVPRYMR
jgi:hypothetical protein